MRKIFPTLFFLSAVLLHSSGLSSASSQEGDEAVKLDPFATLAFRNLGPALMGGRASDVEGVPGDPRLVYVGAASGGVWKSEDGGVRFEPIMDEEPVASIGDIALEPGNPSVVYVGTGESNLRNSVSFGNGVYKSTDAGKGWTHLGLEQTHHISRIVIDPAVPSTVFVGAVGHAFGPNPDRGVFRSEDGGETWNKVLYIDETHGVSDMDIDPENPNIVYAAMWHFQRKPWTFESGSEAGGLFRSTNGGKDWQKIEKGLPKLLGRIGVKVAPSDPNIVYVIAESKEGTLFRSEDRGLSFTKISDETNIVSRGFYFADIRVDPSEANRVYALSGGLAVSEDGGKNFERISRSMHSDYHGLWIDPQNPNRIWQAQDGGVGVSYSRGKSWDYVDVLPISQYYAIFADEREPFYFLGGGMQDNATWIGPSRNGEPFGILNDVWREVSNGDGFQAVTHPDDPEISLTEYQGGRILRTDNKTREAQYISPDAAPAGGAPASELSTRFHWNSPILRSTHDPKTVYFAGNRIFRSQDFGTSWTTVSPDLTTNDAEKMVSAGGPIWPENTTAEYHCTIISVAESPLSAGVLWAGTDDGNLQLSRDSGANWHNIVSNVPGLKPLSPVSHIEASRQGDGRAYVAFDRHQFDDPSPYIFLTEDFGATFRPIHDGLPENAYVWVVREDPKNHSLIYAGTEQGLFVTWDEGGEWTRLHGENLPTVAIHDIIVHPRENDLILGTHGRGLWIFDDAAPIQEWRMWRESTRDAAEPSAHLFSVRDSLRFSVKPTRYGIGDRQYRAKNPDYGALVTYYLDKELEEEAALKLEVLDDSGNTLRSLDKLERAAGLHRIAWDLRLDPPATRKRESEKEPKKGEEEEQRRGPTGPQVPTGRYALRLTAGDEVATSQVRVVLNPMVNMDREGLEEQYRLARDLWAAESGVIEVLVALDVLKDELESRTRTAKDMHRALSEDSAKAIEESVKSVEAFQEELTEPDKKDDPGNAEAPRLLEKLRYLRGVIDSGSHRPTPAQQELFATLMEKRKELASALEEELAKLRTLNEGLASEHQPEVLLPETPGPIQGLAKALR